MIEINLLPWREHQRRRQLQNKIILCGFFVVLLLAALGCYRYWQPRSVIVSVFAPPAIPVVEKWQGDLQQIRFIGFVHQQKRIWALLLLPDGKTADVQVGGIVMNKVRVAAINEQHVVFALPNHQFFTVSLAGM
jgi:hypothetical protein